MYGHLQFKNPHTLPFTMCFVCVYYTSPLFRITYQRWTLLYTVVKRRLELSV